jgi:CRP/FNR family transcriptional regulator
MLNSNEKVNSRTEYIKALYNQYPILEKIDKENNKIVTANAYFKNIYADESIVESEEACNGIIFVLEGIINIQKLNIDGEQTNLYNIKQGEFCHEALSCISNLESLKITAIAQQFSSICIIPVDIVKQYLFQDQEFLLYIYQDLYNKFSAIIENKEKMLHQSLDERLIKLLLSKNSNIIYSTHKQLAFEVDSAREVISRSLKSIERRGYIRLERGKIVLLKDLNQILKDKNKEWSDL